MGYDYKEYQKNYVRKKQEKEVDTSDWISSFDNLIGMNEASEKWEKSRVTLRHNIKWGKFVEDVDVKKFGNQWVFRVESLIREYGEPPAEESN